VGNRAVVVDWGARKGDRGVNESSFLDVVWAVCGSVGDEIDGGLIVREARGSAPPDSGSGSPSVRELAKVSPPPRAGISYQPT